MWSVGCSRPVLPADDRPNVARRLAWAAHIYTASGGFIALVAAAAMLEDRYRDAFAWMAVTVLIDATDGWLARLLKVKERTPGFDGELLDNIVDYVTYVFVPALAVVRARIVPEPWAMPIAGAMLVASAIGFSRAGAKTADYFFTGFPSYWNIVVFYLFAFGWTQTANAVVLVALIALVFVPIGYVYPSRTPTLRRLTVALGAAWGTLVLAMIARVPDVPRPWLWMSMVFPVYYVALSLVLHARRNRG